MTRTVHRDPRTTARSVAGCALMVLVLGVTSAAGATELRSGPPSPSAWAAKVCGTLSTWRSRVGQGTGSLPANATPADVKAAVVRFVDTTATATDSVASTLRRVTAPKAPGAASTTALINDTFATLAVTIHALKPFAAGLSANDPTQLHTELVTLDAQLQQAFGTADQRFQTILDTTTSSTALTRAVTHAAVCTAFLKA